MVRQTVICLCKTEKLSADRQELYVKMHMVPVFAWKK